MRLYLWCKVGAGHRGGSCKVVKLAEEEAVTDGTTPSRSKQTWENKICFTPTRLVPKFINLFYLTKARNLSYELQKKYLKKKH